MMKSNDSEQVMPQSQDSVDQINATFYGQFPYPWRPAKFERLHEPGFHTLMLNQNVGDWSHQTFSGRLKIWVAGCGTNQAVITALNFPEAEVIGSDLSEASLELGASTARELGVKNLELRRESINHVPYSEEFDYIISTGVIHHNANPELTLMKLNGALKRSGVMELMVYSRYERLQTTAFQKAIRLLDGESEAIDYEAQLSRAKRIAGEIKLNSSFDLSESNMESYPDSLLADLLIQPVENSYTVESFEELAALCNLEMLYPCPDVSNKDSESTSWNMKFNSPELQSVYDALPDTKRWQVTNHLMFERSPQLWFYFQRADSGRPRKDEKQICQEFLQTRFARAATIQHSYIRQADDRYQLSERKLPYPLSAPSRPLQQLIELIDGRRSMGEIFSAVGMETSFRQVNHIRLQLCTTAFPYLKAVGKAEKRNSVEDEAQLRRKMEASKLKKFKTIRPKVVQLTSQNG